MSLPVSQSARPEAASCFDLAVLGADDPAGGVVLHLLEEREVPVGRLFPLTLRDPELSVSFQGQDWPCEPAEGFDFGQVQALLVASAAPGAERVAQTVRARYPTMPVLGILEVNPAAAVAVSRVLKTLAAVGDGLQAVDAFVALPVAMAGQAGVGKIPPPTPPPV